MSGPAGYFITFTCYGERLHGDPRGSVERVRHLGAPQELEPDPGRSERERQWLQGASQTLDERQRPIVAAAIQGVCDFKGWHLHALNVRTNHVHAVVSAWEGPEKVMTNFKIWSTRRLRENGLLDSEQKLWTRHGSTKHLLSEQDVIDAIAYVLDGQGRDLGGKRVPPSEE